MAAGLRIAGVRAHGARIVVIAVDGVVPAARRRLARIEGADVLVVANGGRAAQAHASATRVGGRAEIGVIAAGAVGQGLVPAAERRVAVVRRAHVVVLARGVRRYTAVGVAGVAFVRVAVVALLGKLDGAVAARRARDETAVRHERGAGRVA